MRPGILLGLLACNLIWSAHPTMGKLVLTDLSPEQGAWARYLSALLAYCSGALVLRRRAPGLLPQPFARPRSTRDAALIFGLGFLTFCFSPLMQMTGLSATQATDNALIIAMEPLMTVLLAWIVLGERISAAYIGSLAAALAGFGLLTGLSPARLSHGMDSHLTGNLVLLVSLFGEASYSVLGRKLTARFHPASVFGTALAFGVGGLTLAVLLHLGPRALWIFPQLSWRSILGLAWLGPLGTACTYLFWMVAVTQVPVSSLALTLFIQPLFGSLWAILLLHDRLGSGQILGGALILFAVVGQSWFEQRTALKERLTI